MKILVAGVGFIGSHLVSYLKEKGHYVRAVDPSFADFRKDLWGKADELLKLDMKDIRQVMLATKDIDMVFWLCSDMGGVGYFNAHDYYPFLNNMQMDINILKACEERKIGRLFYSSSACIYPIHLQMEEGKPPNLSEDMIYPANSDLSYGWEKLMMLRLCERAPFDARVGIFHTIYGPYQEYQGERMKAPTAMATKALKSLETGKFEIWGNGRQMRSFLYIDDALEKIYRVAMDDKYYGPVNIGSDMAYSIDDVARLACRIVGSDPEFIHTDAKPSGVLARNCDNTKFEHYYEYRNQIALREGFTRLIDWLKTI
jgi:GDP-D-mannose 3',5'-epimerase